jgi:phage tail sheath gpL-like
MHQRPDRLKAVMKIGDDVAWARGSANVMPAIGARPKRKVIFKSGASAAHSIAAAIAAAPRINIFELCQSDGSALIHKTERVVMG